MTSPSFSHLFELRAFLQKAGVKPLLKTKILRQWLLGKPLEPSLLSLKGISISKRFAMILPLVSARLEALLCSDAAYESSDGARFLSSLASGEKIESVRLPKGGLCVSSQVGCAVACAFCMTGQSGLIAHLSDLEILAQVVLARRMHPVSKVVFMGMGEPSHNLEAVLSAIEVLGKEGGIAHKNLVLSTVGDARVFDRLMRLSEADVRPALAISLHSSFDEKRKSLMKNMPSISVFTLIEKAEAYARKTGYPIQYQWTLLKGVNDQEEELIRLSSLLKGKYAMMNFIAYNAVPHLPFVRVSEEGSHALIRMLRSQGIIATLRDSAAQTVEGGCGQLRARSVHVKKPLKSMSMER